MSAKLLSGLLASLAAFCLLSTTACSKNPGLSGDSGGGGQNQALQEARRSAEEAEQKAHELREKKSEQQDKTSSSH